MLKNNRLKTQRFLMSISEEAFKYPLEFTVIKKCKVTKARYSRLKLPHATVETPIFMPVGTKGTLKGILTHQIKELECNLILANTYHLGTRPGTETLKKAGGLHKFMNWNGALLTDSGGFQMVSLCKLSEVTEEGVKFISPVDGEEILLTPEKSMEIQNAIGADIMMQLDDVVSSTLKDRDRVEEAMWRSLRWLDRSIKAHSRKNEQNLFPIVQGGLDPELRKISANEVIKRNTSGYAIGGLSGGESKDDFWRMVTLSTDILPENKPRYLMGVGFAIDLVVCSALGCDMYDCVFPTRTARFGAALTDNGQLILKKLEYSNDLRPIDEDCKCYTCQNYTRAFLRKIAGEEATSASLISIHNVAYQMRLMKRIRKAIDEERFHIFAKEFVTNYYKYNDNGTIPTWVKEALGSVNIKFDN